MGACITPYIVTMKQEGRNVPVPCGKCPDCVARRVSWWSFRLMQEYKRSKSAFFLTLTFDTTKVPITPSGYMTLDKPELQRFFKRLRKVNEQGIKYYSCGEYGGKTMRPHYHIIMFNVLIETIDPSWNRGLIHYGQVNEASVGYTLKYMAKPSKIPLHRNDDRLPEFSLMSKGLGSNYLTERMLHWHEADINERMYCNIENGKRISMPRYYREKIYTKEQREHIAEHLASKMLGEYEKRESEGYQNHGDNWEKVKVELDQNRFKKIADDAKNRNKV